MQKNCFVRPTLGHVIAADTKLLIAEDDYLLQDTANEEKYNFTLTDALSRAKKNEGQLLVGHTFYVTPKVPVDLKLLRNIVTSGGGQVSGEVHIVLL